MKIIQNKDISALNTFGVPCIAAQYSKITSASELKPVKDNNAIFILGGGSNILLPEKLNKWVWHNDINYVRVDHFDDVVEVHVGAGVEWHELVRVCTGFGWSGIENLALIPGKVGASPVQNIGAYGVELKDVFVSLKAFHLTTGDHVTFDKQACKFGYRQSVFKQEAKGQYFITEVTLRLKSAGYALNTSYYALQEALEASSILEPTIQDVFDAVVKVRSSKLPSPKDLGNSGSFFKNPIIDRQRFEALKSKFPEIKYFEVDEHFVKIPTGYLIESCGWKGRRIGDVGCYEKQALVIVNFGGASAKDIKQFVAQVKSSVFDTYGIELEEEVNLIPEN